jgi:methylsterol monooxygenase
MLHRYFYWIHKQHHEVIHPVPLSTFYVHPLEHIFVNVFPILLPLWWLQRLISPLFVWVWIFFSIESAMHNHSGSGYIPSVEFHDTHHRRPDMNYGITGTMDLLLLALSKLSLPRCNNKEDMGTKG